MKWYGAGVLRPFLVPIDDLVPNPGNPRRGDVAAIVESLDTFGQMLPVLTDGKQLVVGHHVTLAARELGWTHVAAISNEFPDYEAARAFMIADNRTHDRGSYDLAALAEHLEKLAALDKLSGTGYIHDDLDGFRAMLGEREQLHREPPVDEPTKVDVVLSYTNDQRMQLRIWERMIEKERGTRTLSDTYYVAMGIAANFLNG